MKQVDVDSLSIGAELGDGGQGKVFALEGMPDVVFKRYHDSVAAASIPLALAALEAQSTGLLAGGRPIDNWAAWPRTQVCENGHFIGFLMPRVSEQFTLHVGGRRRLADLSYLATSPRPVWGSVSLPDTATRLRILAAYCTVIEALHQRELVLGDMSFGNVLWSGYPTPGVMLLDCDGIRPETGPVHMAQYDTLDWNDPLAVASQQPDRDRDRYKLALAVVRVLTKSLSIRPGELGESELDLPEHVAPRVRHLAERAAGPVGTRPSAAEWRSALQGRKTLSVSQPVPRALSIPPTSPDVLIRRGPRRTRPVSPLGAP